MLCLVNREANDNHLAVVDLIINKHTLPEKNECWECFQPKLYYIINVAIIAALGIEAHFDKILCMQMLNFIFSFFILFYLWKFINRQHFSFRIKLVAFALLAFNSCLIGINAQATNDTAEILAGILALYFTDRFFREKNFFHLCLLTIFIVLASLIKASGLIFFFALLIIFVIQLITAKKHEHKLLIKGVGFFTISYLTIVPFAGGYWHNYKLYHDPFVVCFNKMNPPDFLHQTIASRPGIRSIADGFFTFRYFDMIRQPYIENEVTPFSLHRTSLWSQLYGRTLFVHFDQFPVGWQSKDPVIISVGRLLIILGIIPLLLLLAGMLKCTKDFFSQQKSLVNDWMHLVVIAGFLAFMIKYSYDYRDFSVMKSIFIFPALPSFINLFMYGFALIKSKPVINIIYSIMSAIVLLSIYDCVFLIQQLQ